MNYESYAKLMSYLDGIEAELNKIAKKAGHYSFEEFMAQKEAPMKKAA